MAKTKEPKLTIEHIPKTCHFSNVRTTVKAKDWDKIRFLSYEAAGNKCEICKCVGTDQGYKHNLECHEIWEYNDETHVQRLAGLVSLCPICHQVKHIGRAIKMGRLLICVKKLMQINKWTREQVDKYIADSFEINKERSKHQWTLDLSILNKAPYGLKIDLKKERVFEVKKYKKKRRKKKITIKRAVKKTALKKKGKRPPKKKS